MAAGPSLRHPILALEFEVTAVKITTALKGRAGIRLPVAARRASDRVGPSRHCDERTRVATVAYSEAFRNAPIVFPSGESLLDSSN